MIYINELSCVLLKVKKHLLISKCFKESISKILKVRDITIFTALNLINLTNESNLVFINFLF